jgi:hypothetical protein
VEHYKERVESIMVNKINEDTMSTGRQLTNRELQKLSLEKFIKYTGIKVGLKDIVMLEADTDGKYLFFQVGKLAFAYYNRFGDDEFVAYPDSRGRDGMTIYSQFK